MSAIRLLIPVLLAVSAAAQTETGQIDGVVTDGLGHGVPLATVTVSAISIAGKRSVQTSRNGSYAIAELLPGNYRVEASADGFAEASREIRVHVGSSATVNFRLDLSLAHPKPPGTAIIRVETDGAPQVITQDEIEHLPNLNRNVFWFAGLASNLSDASLGTRGVGFAINGQRESSTNILVDGATNNNEFYGAIGQQLPLDAVQELSILTSGFDARYGRASGGIVNAASRSGTDRFHGSGYEYLRSSALASNTFLSNADSIARPIFAGNDFGYSVGGPLIHRKLYFFSSTEGRTVRSETTAIAWVPTPQFLAQTPANTQAFFQSLGQLRPDGIVFGSASLNSLTASHGANPCTGFECETLSPSLPLFLHVGYRVPTYSPAGWPQNTVQTFNRIDYRASDSTSVYARYALYRETDPAGSLSNSPYNNYDLGRQLTDDTAAISLLHSWNPQWTSETTVAFSRLSLLQQGTTSRGLAPSMYASPFAPVTIGNDPLAFPGYNPFTPGAGGTFGGPENLIQANHDTSWAKGRHLVRFGASIEGIHDDQTDAAYQTAVASLAFGGGVGPALVGLLSGTFAHFQVAIDPQGKLPCQDILPQPNCSVTLPANQPNFSRTDIYNDGSLYIEDNWKVSRRLTVTLGVRWEYFGVQHDARASLDANWYAASLGNPDFNLAQYLRQGQLLTAPQSPNHRLWSPDERNFAPRAGFAWDVFGNGSTAIRGGYGIGYERNSDAVTFNILQNPPNYAVLDAPGPITTTNLGTLASGGTMQLPPLGARIINPDLKTAYAHIWNVSAERQISRSMLLRVEYSGSRGVHLYTISYPNQGGFGNRELGDPCAGVGDCASRPNNNYSEEIGYRGNQGFSSYQGVSANLRMTDLFHLGITLNASYTWSHAIDNMSSTFFEAGGQGVASQYGDQNITTNNGLFDAGLMDPYQPKLDRGDAEFDIRHRIVVMGEWAVPAWRHRGWLGSLGRGWALNPVFVARSGQPFSVFDTSQQTLDLNTPRAAFTGAHPTKRNTYVPGESPDLFHLITFLPAQISRVADQMLPGEQWPAGLSARDSFRAPGFWNLDLAIRKETRWGERYRLELRGDLFNVFNHANLYIIGRSADLGINNTVDGCYGCTGSSYDQRQIQLAVRVSF